MDGTDRGGSLDRYVRMFNIFRHYFVFNIEFIDYGLWKVNFLVVIY